MLVPIQWNEKHKSWFVHGYAAARALLTDSRVSSDTLSLLYESTFPSDQRQRVQPLIDFFHSWLFFSDPPYHTLLRKLLNPFFTQAAVAEREEKIRAIIDALLIDLGCEFDVVAVLAKRLPIRVMMLILGIPEKDGDMLLSSIDKMKEFMDSRVRMPEQYEPALIALSQVKNYLNEFVAQNSDVKFVKMLHEACLHHPELRVDQFWKIIAMLLMTGTETTTNLIGNGLYYLLKNTEQKNYLMSQPDQWQTAVDELLRFSPPVHSMIRRAKESIEIENIVIQKGDFIRFIITDANRDESQFKNADKLDVTRSPNQHLSFGFGIHYCLGRLLALKTATLFFKMFFQKYPDAYLIEEPEWHEGITLRGLTHCKVGRWHKC